MINKANEKEGVLGLCFDPNEISIEKNPFPKLYHKVDGIFVKECIHHIPREDRVRVFKFLKSLLKDDAIIVI